MATKIYGDRAGREIWVQFDESAEVYEIFRSEECNDYIGCADTIEEALKIGLENIKEDNR